MPLPNAVFQIALLLHLVIKAAAIHINLLEGFPPFLGFVSPFFQDFDKNYEDK